MRNPTIFLATVWLAAAPLFSQNTGGPSAVSRQPLAVRAVVIGISDYQETDIPDLRFADRDAEAFANYLRSPAGGSLDSDHLQVLTNEKATAGRVAEALDALVEQTKEGEQVIIYFSGHGDVERKIISQPGFLLCWDSPGRIYMGGGTYSLGFLEAIVSTLSVENKAKVLVITDACHAGKLAGSQIGGAQITGDNLAKQFASEVKILSCQPNELSLEGEQWGGGRGIFSYHLVEGLFGMADKNGDGAVTVGEIDYYLEDNVTAEAAPQSQVPIVLGNKTERLATVNAGVLADLKKFKKGESKVFMAIASRGLEENVLSGLDSGIVKKYFAFKKAVAEKRFFSPENDCAEIFYTSLSTEPAIAPLHGFLKRNYAAALQDDAQQVLNVWLKTDIKEISLSTETKRGKYGRFPGYLARAAELLGTAHYLYRELRARSLYFEGYLMVIDNRSENREMGEQALAKYRQALQWQPGSPFVHYQLGMLNFYQFAQPDSAEQCMHRATVLAPSWIMPYSWMGYMYSDGLSKFRDLEKTRHFLGLADRVDSTAASSSLFQMNNWGVYYYETKQFKEAEQRYKRMIQMDSTFIWAYGNLGILYYTNGMYPEAEALIKKCAALDPTNFWPYYHSACIQARQGQLDMAFYYLELSLAKGFMNYDWMHQDADLAPLRALPEWAAMMKKHFSDKVKD